MRNLDLLNKYRVANPLYRGDMGDDKNGAFMIPHSKTGVTLFVIASNGEGWDHVSVSLRNNCPNWQEMDFIKRLFFEDHECAIQVHVPVKDHISLHPHCLHLWRPQFQEIPLPPKKMVA